MNLVKITNIPGFEQYLINTNGDVYQTTFKNGTTFKILVTPVKMTPHPNSQSGYMYFNLCKDGKRKRLFVHRLVLAAFVGPCPVGLQAAHMDGNKLNNSLSNLQWVSGLVNIRHKPGHGTQAMGEEIHLHKLTNKEVIVIKGLLSNGAKQAEIARTYGVDPSTISHLNRGFTWKHIQ